MAICPTDTLCQDLCKALGFDPKLMRKLVLTMEVDNVVTVDAETFTNKDGIKDVATIVKKYHLVLAKPPDLTTVADPSRVFGRE